ncbi:MAG: ATP-binding protein [Candidatus Pedobacter colombiensis]|uniref:histidine kinase n=1 Tax=Candidatus Pedobacter colombiensis TaxID=3121371 RepID=A0AAJ6BAK4_9SPHI|nr:ATP-binding protein [Pedobacter sp.]WEK21348.1 MAG: ATP-binding protein [Pedobacter sp.]
MYIPERTILLFFVAFTLILLLLTGAFIYMVYSFRNRKNQRYGTQSLLLIEGQKDKINEYERWINELSRHLHDDIQQQAVLISNALNSTRMNLLKVAPSALPELVESINKIDVLVEKITSINQSINLEYIRSQSLLSLVKDQLVLIMEETDIDYMVECEIEPILTDEVKIILYRIASEAISNIAQHAMASTIIISISAKDGCFCMSIEDNGIGLNQEKIYGAPTYGIPNMRSRAALINATLEIKSEKFRGTKVVLEIKDVV